MKRKILEGKNTLYKQKTQKKMMGKTMQAGRQCRNILEEVKW